MTLLAGGAGCGFTPLTNKVEVGDEAFVVAVGEAEDGSVDLFAAPAEGGRFYQFTFNRLVESNPKVAPSGTKLAFLRRAADRSTPDLILLNLLNGTETEWSLPPEAGPVVRLGFGSTDDSLVVATEHALYLVTGTGVESFPATNASGLDSLTYERVGEIGFASLRPCRSGTGWCVARDAQETALPPDASDPIRWGNDALAYRRNGTIEVRPLGGGRVRQPTWSNPPSKLSQPSHHPGSRRL